MNLSGVMETVSSLISRNAYCLLVSVVATQVVGCIASTDDVIFDELPVDEADVQQSSQQLVVDADPYFSANRSNLVPNPSFEFEGEQQWVSWNSTQPAGRVATSGLIGSGHHGVLVVDSSEVDSAGVVTKRVPAVPGRSYTASVRVTAQGRGTLFLQFHAGLGVGASDRIGLRKAHFSPGEGIVTVSAVAPPGTRYVDVLVYSSLDAVGFFLVDDVSLVAQDNLVPNGDFSAGDSNASLPNWSAYRDTNASLVSSPAFNGRFAVKWSDATADGSQGVVSERFGVSPGQVLTVSGRAKYTGSRPSLYLRFFEAEDSSDRLSSASVTFQQGSGWEFAQKTVEVPVGAQYAEVLGYSCVACTGTYHVDDIQVRSARNLLLNGDAEDAESSEWSGTAAHYTTSARVNGARSIMFQDASTSSAAAVRSEPLPVIAGQRYELSGSIFASKTDGLPVSDDCKAWLAVEFYPSTKRASSTSQRISLSKANPTDAYAALACADHGGSWVPRRLTVTAPENAYAAKVLLYSTEAGRGRYYFDGIRFGEVQEPAVAQTFIVDVVGSGAADGSSVTDAAKYNDPSFWNDRVLPALKVAPVEVVLESKSAYRMFRLSDQLAIEKSTGTHRLTIRGERPGQTVIVHATGSGDVSQGFKGEDLFRFQSFSGGITIRDLMFSGLDRAESDYKNTGYRLGNALKVRNTSNVEVTNVGFYDIHGIHYAAFQPVGDMDGLLFRDNHAARLGYDGHAHFSYALRDINNIQYVGNFFEDCPGAYVRFRNNSDVAAIIRNRFQSTGTYYLEGAVGTSYLKHYRNQSFLQWAIFNDGVKESGTATCWNKTVDRRHAIGNEWLGLMRATVENNVFQWLQPYPDDTQRSVITIVHSGFNPTNGSDTLGLLDVTSSNLTASRIENHFGVDTSDWIEFYDNDYAGTRSGKLAQVDVYTRTDRFYDIDSQACFDMGELHSPNQRIFYADGVLGIP